MIDWLCVLDDGKVTSYPYGEHEDYVMLKQCLRSLNTELEATRARMSRYISNEDPVVRNEDFNALSQKNQNTEKSLVIIVNRQLGINLVTPMILRPHLRELVPRLVQFLMLILLR